MQPAETRSRTNAEENRNLPINTEARHGPLMLHEASVLPRTSVVFRRVLGLLSSRWGGACARSGQSDVPPDVRHREFVRAAAWRGQTRLLPRLWGFGFPQTTTELVIELGVLAGIPVASVTVLTRCVEILAGIPQLVDVLPLHDVEDLKPERFAAPRFWHSTPPGRLRAWP